MADPTPITDATEIREQITRITTSNSFRRRRKLIRLLEYLVTETIAGRIPQLTQRTIAAEVFGLAESHDGENDANVRISAGRLRDLLNEYYRKEAEPWEIRVFMPPRRYYIAADPPKPVVRGHVMGESDGGITSSKKISHSDIIGELGVNLIEKRCLEMGFVWYATRLEAGIDGYIEIRGSKGDVTNCIIQVQSKATERAFEAETASCFEFRCSDRDLNYWLAGNAPVVLVRSRPKTDEAYWVSLKEYFKDPARRKSGKIIFDKARDRFDASAKPELERLATRSDSGFYLGARPIREIVYSNLLRVASFPSTYHIASTEYRTRAELFAALRDFGRNVHGEWILNSRILTSFHDLSSFPWTNVCDRGTVEELETREWAQSDDPIRQREFVRLLNACLRDRLYRKGIRFSSENQYYYFRASQDLSDREYVYQSREHKATRTVFKGYPDRRDHMRMSYYRHAAFAGRFVRYGSEWYLQITPTYHFTWDGERLSRFAPDLLSGIKRLETNQAVHGQVVMWAHLMTERSLFDTGPHFLEFGSLVDFDLDAGLDDEAWLKREDDADKIAVLQSPGVDERQWRLSL